MFYRVPDASKVAFAYLVAQLDRIGTMLFDCQVINDHTMRLGAVCVRRSQYLRALEIALHVPALYAGARWPEIPPPPATRTAAAHEAPRPSERSPKPPVRRN